MSDIATLQLAANIIDSVLFAKTWILTQSKKNSQAPQAEAEPDNLSLDANVEKRLASFLSLISEHESVPGTKHV